MIKCNEIDKSMYVVEALPTYKENSIADSVLGYIPKPGEQFEVTKERLDVLLGKNERELVFVKVIAEPKKEEVKPKKSVKKKKTTK